MLIRSQNKKYLVPMGQLIIVEDPISVDSEGNPIWLIITPTSYKMPNFEKNISVEITKIELGAYSSEDRAIEVLGDIQSRYEHSLYTSTYNSKDACGNVPCIHEKNIVFQMPEK